MWTDDQVRMLIDERKANNEYYPNLSDGGKSTFWEELVCKINIKYKTKFSGQQAREKFQGIIRSCKVNKNIYLIFTIFFSLKTNLM